MTLPDARHKNLEPIDLTHVRPEGDGVALEYAEFMWIVFSVESINWMRSMTPKAASRDEWLVRETLGMLPHISKTRDALGCRSDREAASILIRRFRKMLDRFPVGRIRYGKIDDGELAYFMNDRNVVFILYRTVVGDAGPPVGGYDFQRTVKITTRRKRECPACQRSKSCTK